ncbi:hypothetical protein ARMGADRAFT_1022465 [Armillaria gallica]|uniref:Uncharacterized protein n=1 Tax=Armillaria gallica TaxID=47427 RepID=A0A2H3EMV0_ARMGA|nr:hypothetical protein ARMGADRAFT_1022465 [Armillaria gallica]
MDDDSNQVLTHMHHVKLDDICSNLHGAQIYTAAYFELGALNRATVDELDAHMDTLSLFKLVDSSYGLTLHSLIYHVTRWIPAVQHVRAWKVWELSGSEHLQNTYDFPETLCILGDPGYAPDDDSSVREADLRLFCLAVVPPPIKPAVMPSSSKSVDVPVPSASRASIFSKKVPKPKMICTPQAPREPSFASPTKKQVSMVLPPKNAKSSPPMMCKCLHAPEPVKTTLVLKVDKAPPAKPVAPKLAVQMHATTKKKVPMPTKPKPTVKKPILMDSSSDSEVEHESDGEEDTMEGSHGEAPEGEGWLSDKIEVPLIKKPHLVHAEGSNPPPPLPTDPVPPLPVTEPPSKSKGKGKATEPSSPASPSLRGHATRNKRSPPCSSKDHCKTHKSPVPSGSKAGNAVTPTLEADNIDLQFHEPPSRQALESMKLSMLPPAPNSLTKAPMQVCNGWEYVYRCHSNIDPHFIHPPLLTWPCYNCTLFGYPDECEFKGEVGKEVCTRCKTGHHGPCSARWDANQLHRAATLLDPLTLSSDSAICCGVDHVERINAKIALLGRAMHCLHEDCEKIVGKLADGLDAISSHKHGTEIIDAYMQISNFLKSLVIRLGEDVEDSDAEGRASEAGAA